MIILQNSGYLFSLQCNQCDSRLGIQEEDILFSEKTDLSAIGEPYYYANCVICGNRMKINLTSRIPKAVREKGDLLLAKMDEERKAKPNL